MPVLFPDFDADTKAIEQLALQVCSYWNANGGGDCGFNLFAARDAIEKISHDGDKLLSSFFPEEPGPYKRVAALLVLSRLTPLFALAAPNSVPPDLKPILYADEQQWLPRVCYLLVPLAFSLLSIRVDQETRPVPAWNDFPSLHSKTEFLTWLEWLRDYPPEAFAKAQTAEQEHLDRRGRMVLATALILEAVSYQGGGSGGICASCDKRLVATGNHRLLFFDAFLSQTKREREKSA